MAYVVTKNYKGETVTYQPKDEGFFQLAVQEMLDPIKFDKALIETLYMTAYHDPQGHKEAHKAVEAVEKLLQRVADWEREHDELTDNSLGLLNTFAVSYDDAVFEDSLEKKGEA